MPGKFFYRPTVRRFFDLAASPLAWAGALFFRYFRKTYGHGMPLTKKILSNKGVYPVLDRYDEPLINPKNLPRPLNQPRKLPGIDLNTNEQLSILRQFNFNSELLGIPVQKTGNEFYYNNGVFESGDAEYLYNMIRKFKPRRLIEAGGGFSTLIAAKAVARNQEEDRSFNCDHTCIDPYPSGLLENSGAKITRQKIETLGTGFFSGLTANDILFIDTSHMIRPQGDVLFIYQELLPSLPPGVWVHIHDIFTPRDYPSRWLIQQNLFWNEQYLLEAFLAFNKEFRVTGALNYLKHNFSHELSACCPVLASQPDREPGSFWLVKN